MSRLEFVFAGAILRLVAMLASLLPFRSDRVVLATARVAALEGNLLYLERAIRAHRPDLRVSLLLEPYGYGLRAKLEYPLRLLRGMVLLRTSRYVIADNAYLPIHVAPHPRRTTVIQVWHAAGARAVRRRPVEPLTEPEATFLHRYYDIVVTSGEASREPWSAALRTPLEQVLALGTPRTDALLDGAAMATTRDSVLTALRSLPVGVSCSMRRRSAAAGATSVSEAPWTRVPSARRCPTTYALVLKTHPNLDARDESTFGYDLVAEPTSQLNDLSRGGRHPGHGLLVLDLRVGAPPSAARAAGR